MRAVIAAIHGILTGGTNPDWPSQFEAWLSRRDPEMHVVTRHYFAGPFPRLNWIQNQYRARALANELELFQQTNVSPPTWFVAHSNGAVIAWMAAQALIKRGHHIGGMILTGAALEADVQRNQILTWLGTGDNGGAIAYSSEDDAVVAGDPHVSPHWYWRVRDAIWGKLMWPYGSLGRTGWMLRELPYSYGTVFTRWYSGGHSSYFAPARINRTFEQMYQDILNPRNRGKS